MSSQAVRRLGFASFALTMSLLVGGEVLNALAPRPTLSEFFRFYPVAIAFAVVGVLVVVRRPGNRVGWLASAIGLLSAIYDATMSYAAYAPSARWAAALGIWGWFPSEMLTLGVLPLVFPAGKLPSARWRPVLWLAAGGMVAAAVVGFSGWRPGDPAVSTAPLLAAVFGFAQISFLVCLILALSSVVVRYRRAGSEERQQLKWFVDAVLLVILFLLGAQVVGRVVFHVSPFDVAVVDGLIHLSFVAIPVAIGMAILKYHLYDIDLVVNKTILFAAMAAFITAVYVAIVVGLGALLGTAGKPNLALSILATALVAIAFGPVRERVQRVANLLVYGQRATPYEVMADFGERMADAVSIADVLPRMAEAAGHGVGAVRTRIRLLLSDGGQRVVDWPAPAADAMDDRIFPISHGGQVVGDIAVSKAAGDPLTPAESKLLNDLAGQAGLVLHNARLAFELQARLDQISLQAEELRASRQRIVSAQDEERRRLERTIREGTERQLAAIDEQLSLAEQTLDPDGQATARLLESLIVTSNQTLEELRDLARGLYPPLLRDQGLLPALRAQAIKLKARIKVDGEGIGRFPAEVEGAVYFCCIEALRRSPASATIRLFSRDDELEFSIDAPALRLDGRLQDIEDRIAALGGSLRLSANQLTGRVPVRVLEPVR
jgi:signal transduction histidine kinase